MEHSPMPTPKSQEPIIITMVGPSGVGKTSLLAAMYSHIKEDVRDLHCSFTCGPGIAAELDEREQELRDFAEGEGIKVQKELGTGITQDKRVFPFNLHFTKPDSKIPDIPLEFIDLPGGWYTSKGNFEEADRCLAMSRVLVVAVDAWAVMEQSGKYNTRINKPKQISDAIERAANTLKSGEHPPLILFVLVKAEKYLHKNKHQDLLEKVRKNYDPLIQALLKRKFPFPIAGCAVETVGGVELNCVIDVEGSPVGEFIRLPHIGYAPKHCALPLRLVFQMALKHKMSRTPTQGSLWEKLKSFFFETELSNNIRAHEELEKLAETLTSNLSKEPIVWINHIAS